MSQCVTLQCRTSLRWFVILGFDHRKWNNFRLSSTFLHSNWVCCTIYWVVWFFRNSLTLIVAQTLKTNLHWLLKRHMFISQWSNSILYSAILSHVRSLSILQPCLSSPKLWGHPFSLILTQTCTSSSILTHPFSSSSILIHPCLSSLIIVHPHPFSHILAHPHPCLSSYILTHSHSSSSHILANPHISSYILTQILAYPNPSLLILIHTHTSHPHKCSVD